MKKETFYLPTLNPMLVLFAPVFNTHPGCYTQHERERFTSSVTDAEESLVLYQSFELKGGVWSYTSLLIGCIYNGLPVFTFNLYQKLRKLSYFRNLVEI